MTIILSSILPFSFSESEIPDTEMATQMEFSANERKGKGKVSLPAKRGQVKARIFKEIIRTVIALASKAGEKLTRNGGKDGSSF
ncbi:hypothetical protein ACLOJK_001565 [Asimina triloba]